MDPPESPGTAVTCQVACRIPLDLHTSSTFVSTPALPLVFQQITQTDLVARSCRLLLYSNSRDNVEHLAFVFGDALQSRSLNAVRPGETAYDRAVRGAAPPEAPNAPEAPEPLVRLHSSCFTGEVVGSMRCDCAEQLREAQRILALEGSGVIVYLNQEGRGIGLREKLKAYNLQDQGHDTVSANEALGLPVDARSYDVAALILADLGISTVRLLTNNPLKIAALETAGIRVASRIEMVPRQWRALLGATGTAGAATDGVYAAASVVSVQRGDAAGETAARTPPPSTPAKSTCSSSPAFPSLQRDAAFAVHRPSSDLDTYLVTKIQRMEHLLSIPPAVLAAAGPAPAASANGQG